MNSGDTSEKADYVRAFKRALTHSISNQLFNEAADDAGTIVTNRNVPNRAGIVEKMSMFLQWNRRNCKMFKAMKVLSDSPDPQMRATARIVQVGVHFYYVQCYEPIRI